MKSQLSQLPLIVGSGRVLIRRALFSCLVPESQTLVAGP